MERPVRWSILRGGRHPTDPLSVTARGDSCALGLCRMIELRTLGALELLATDGTAIPSVLAQPRRAALLCYLALASPRGFHRRDSLYALFWPEHDADHARHALRQSLYFLRHALGSNTIIARGDGELALAADAVRCDAWEFEKAVDDGHAGAALALYRGELLSGFHISDAPDFEGWLSLERERLRRRAGAAAWALAQARARADDASGAADAGRRAAALSPSDETELRRLLVLLDRLGDRSGAVRAYEVFATNLKRDYELEPSDETRALLSRIRAIPPPLAASPSNEIPAGAPHPATLGSRSSGRWRGAITWKPKVPYLEARRRVWAAGALVGVVLLLLGTYLILRVLPGAPAMGRERVLVADFEGRARDFTDGELVAHVLRIELARSPRLSVVSIERIAASLRRMRRDPTIQLNAALAREVALREGIKVLVVGDVRVAGTGVVLTASVVAPMSGEIIYGASETARDSAELLPAIERLSHSIRKRAGESLASIQAGDSLWSFTTSSLPALRKHMAATKAFQRGDFERSAELLSEAIALDPDFAYAHLELATVLENAGRPRGRYLPELARAYALRAGLTDRERYAVEGAYHLRITGDVGKSIVAFQNHVEELRRTGEGGWYGALGFLLRQTGQLQAAEAILQEARVRFPSAINQSVLVELLYAIGKDAQADTVLGEVATRFPEHPFVLELRVRVLAASGAYDSAHTLAAGIPSDVGLPLEAELDAVRGRFGEAIAHLRERCDQALARGMVATAVEIAIAVGRLRLRSGDSAGASEVDQLLRRRRFESIDTLSRPYLPLAQFYAEAGQARQARAWLNRYQGEFPAQYRGPDRWMLHRAQAAVYQAEGRPAQALEEFRLAVREPAIRVGMFDDELLPTADHPELARLYDQGRFPRLRNGGI